MIAAGGGGIPVVRGRDGQWRGVEAVIDKDFASSLLASELHAEMYVVLTGVAKVSIDFEKPTQKTLDRMTRRRSSSATSPRASSPPARWARRSKPRSSSSTAAASRC